MTRKCKFEIQVTGKPKVEGFITYDGTSDPEIEFTDPVSTLKFKTRQWVLIIAFLKDSARLDERCNGLIKIIIEQI